MKKSVTAFCLSASLISLGFSAQAAVLGARECVVHADANAGRPSDLNVTILADLKSNYSVSFGGKLFRSNMTETKVSDQNAIQLTTSYLQLSMKGVASMSVIENSNETPELKIFAFWSSQEKLISTAILIDGAIGGECVSLSNSLLSK